MAAKRIERMVDAKTNAVLMTPNWRQYAVGHWCGWVLVPLS
ncbi:hypothetical protein [Paraflavitalea speifideaquila]|nr:hypothetical protein [Paraflavitalea speifideiaquila]